jgi:hypothetical protein
MLSVRHLVDVPDDFMPEHPEGGAFYKAFAKAALPGFDLGCLQVLKREEVVLTVPYFVMDFNMGTMMSSGWAKSMLSRINLKIACVGHPSADFGHLNGEVTEATLGVVNAELQRLAPIACYKGFGSDLPLPDFACIEGLPVPVLDVPADFWQRISSRRRRDLNRQLKYSADLKFVETDGLPNQWVDRIHELYLATHHKSDTQFERLNRDYFLATSSLSRYLLFFEGEELIGFAQTLCAHGQMMHKYVGMDYERNRQHRLYFALFLKAIDICIRDGLTKLDTGVTAYDFKRHLGSRMQPTWIYYRHNNSFAHALLRRFAFLLKPDEAELRGVEMPPSA